MIKQQGFTLIELMVSLTIGLLLVAVAVQLFISELSDSASRVHRARQWGIWFKQCH